MGGVFKVDGACASLETTESRIGLSSGAGFRAILLTCRGWAGPLASGVLLFHLHPAFGHGAASTIQAARGSSEHLYNGRGSGHSHTIKSSGFVCAPHPLDKIEEISTVHVWGTGTEGVGGT